MIDEETGRDRRSSSNGPPGIAAILRLLNSFGHGERPEPAQDLRIPPPEVPRLPVLQWQSPCQPVSELWRRRWALSRLLDHSTQRACLED